MAQAGNNQLDEMHHVTGRYYPHGEYEGKRGAVLAPVELYKLGDVYYVLDGHHRVAAAVSLGQVEIDAVVTKYAPARETEPAA